MQHSDFLYYKDSKSKKHQRELINSMLDYLNSEQLAEVISNLKEPYYMAILDDYLQGFPLPEYETEEFTFLVLAYKYHGNIVRKLIVDEGISDYYFKKYTQKYGLIEIANGIHIFPNQSIDGQFLFQQQYSRAVISHETALYLQNFTEVIPKATYMSMPRNYNFQQLIKNMSLFDFTVIDQERSNDGKKSIIITFLDNDPIRIVKNEAISDNEIIELTTFYGNPIRVTSPERSIADILKPSHRAEEEIKQEAIIKYVSMYPENKQRLRRIAKSQNVLAILDSYLLKYT